MGCNGSCSGTAALLLWDLGRTGCCCFLPGGPPKILSCFRILFKLPFILGAVILSIQTIVSIYPIFNDRTMAICHIFCYIVRQITDCVLKMQTNILPFRLVAECTPVRIVAESAHKLIFQVFERRTCSQMLVKGHIFVLCRSIQKLDL